MTDNQQDPGESGYVKPFSPERMRAMQAEWRELYRLPEEPPMANLALARELLGVDTGRRSIEFRGRTYHFPPLSFLAGLECLQLAQEMEHAEGAISEPADLELEDEDAQLAHRLRQASTLRDAYAGVAAKLWALIENAPRKNPFLRCYPDDLHRLLSFVLASGNEVKPPALRFNPEHPPAMAAYDAAFNLVQYLARFGHLPGMMAGSAPASWRHFMAATAFLRRESAEQSLTLYEATAAAQSTEEGHRKFLERTARRAGQEVA